MKRVLALLIALWAAPLLAQDDAVIDVETTDATVVETTTLADTFADQAEWEALAGRVEVAVENGQTSNSVLGELRSDLADWRDTFLELQSANAGRIDTVQSQITALGALPEDGSDEDLAIASRRATLTAQLSELQAPVVLAAEAYAQADGLIGEIDTSLRDRQTDEFTERSQSPLVPSGWSTAWTAVSTSFVSIGAEITGEVENPSRQTEFFNNLPAILALLAAALVLITRGRAWVRWVSGLFGAQSLRGQGVWDFALSLGQVVLPYLGVLALAQALDTTEMLGRRTSVLIDAIPGLALLPILAHWLAGHLMPTNSAPESHPLNLEPEVSARAHRRFITLGYMLMAFGMVRTYADANALNTIASAVILFPVGALLAWTLYWLGHVLRRTSSPDAEDAPRSFRVALRAIISRGLMVAAIAGLIFAALGYSNAFELITEPAAQTLYVLGVLILLQRLSVDVYTLLSKRENSAQDALIPVLIGFLLILVSLPVLALIWGAQMTDITELWTRFREGFSIGDTKISPTSFLLLAVVFVIGYTITRLLQGALRSTVLPRTKMDAGGQNAVVSGMGYIGIFLAAVVAITTAGIDLSGLAIVAGALSVGIGFGLQNIVSNFVAGIILLIERPISQGDWIEVGGQMGYVRDISVRSTRIETFDRTDVIVPNADLVSNQVTNWTRGNNVGRVIVPVGVAYSTDTEMVTGILKEIAEAHPMVLLNPPPSVVFQGFGADSLDFEIRAILRDVNYVLSVKSEMNHAIAKRFVEEGIEIPFGQRDIWFRNPEALDFGAKPARKPAKKTPPKEKPDT
ncbi:DUF3772 domain-containing protein [Octadecabacter sp. 1_MG-2023]|uniref:DUF3772 domain-containing protein n=1 Tax=unclassified Octadecabacter TaxID=196158 RepID=UPI001C096CEE|nr:MULTISPECIES: DUF3772 domain-containing protein [unclassified Octadecabacter]MBU2993124.1 DUF3772 domain-containing protein [Octadecabacter sp. B2R22]MDO6733424.1 DUF3772 domain-containing protein [Octadecabacter sp. 1_MG-2023]